MSGTMDAGHVCSGQPGTVGQGSTLIMCHSRGIRYHVSGTPVLIGPLSGIGFKVLDREVVSSGWAGV